MTAPRPLPPTPSLEFARKQAKALLKQLRTNDPVAVARVHATQSTQHDTPAASFMLADAQLTLAREYGFVSWPRLVRYFTTAERQRHRQHSTLAMPSAYEHWARSLLADHAKRRARAGKILAEYTPRLFGLSLREVFRSTITEDEARHALARDIGCVSWSALIAKAEAAIEVRDDGWDVDQMLLALRALQRADLAALQEVTRQYPRLLTPTERETAQNSGIVNMALNAERQRGVDAMRPIMAWLRSHGLDPDTRRHAKLCGSSFMNAADVQSLLDRGANPTWIAPNGLPVLEHALLRYQKGDCVDLIARHVTPRKALWIAAGLGDVETVASFLEGRGRVTVAARANRPDFTAVGPFQWPSHADADDETILFEAAYVAAMNGRVAVLERLFAHGLSPNSLAWEFPLLNIAVQWDQVDVVECLIRHGADPDFRSSAPGVQTAREFVRENILLRLPWSERAHRTAALCGIDVTSELARRAQRPAPTLDTSPELQQIVVLARVDAARQGADAVLLEHLIIGMLRADGMARYFISRGAVDDFNEFRVTVLDRVRVDAHDVPGTLPPLSADVAGVVQDAVAHAARRHDQAANGMHLLDILAQPGTGFHAWMQVHGGQLHRVREMLYSTMQYDNAMCPPTTGRSASAPSRVLCEWQQYIRYIYAEARVRRTQPDEGQPASHRLARRAGWRLPEARRRRR